MAFKRSAVRSRLSPPSPRDCERKPHFFGSGVFALCSDGNDVHAHAELLKVNVKVDMQLVVPVDLHPLDKAVDDHFLCLHAGGVVHINTFERMLLLSFLFIRFIIFYIAFNLFQCVCDVFSNCFFIYVFISKTKCHYC